MSGENVELVRRAYQAINRGPDATFAFIDEFVDPAFGLRASGRLPDVSRIQGREAFRRYFAQVFDAFEIEAEPEEVIDVGGAVVVLARNVGRGKASGAETTNRLAFAWGAEDGKVIYIDAYRTKADALEAVGLRE